MTDGISTWHECGCFTDAELRVFWPCSMHRVTPDGVTGTPSSELREREQEDLRIEADAWLKWAK
jgi:hypothetical protein